MAIEGDDPLGPAFCIEPSVDNGLSRIVRQDVVLEEHQR